MFLEIVSAAARPRSSRCASTAAANGSGISRWSDHPGYGRPPVHAAVRLEP
ncbi:hypothetical protein [Streptomyces sp. UNOB3_S3]|uniref:hypothetical protein n=1 Tax=Streptomyces sp. UNOB3_S3 TaxID=2871682 RepID=UPI001E555EF7|nr:hypothetical protein [Streptomyces sp. UNOB3_S3]MCC3777445.1 hypothetical protein [Streptomyces sp. UNOB3_S3]